MARILVAYASSEGQTERIAHRIAEIAGRHGHQMVLADVREPAAGSVTDDFDAALVAGPIHYGRYDRALKKFLRRHQRRLTSAPSAFVSVSLAAGSEAPEDRAELTRLAEGFFARTGWSPDATHHAAGALRDSRLGFFKRILMHWIMRRQGVALDPSGDTEFTDWAALQAFVEDFLAKAALT